MGASKLFFKKEINNLPVPISLISVPMSMFWYVLKYEKTEGKNSN
jgi:hypothetical protein